MRCRGPTILGMRVDPTSYQDAAEQVLQWARMGESRYVCVANVHMVMEAYDNALFRQIVNEADLVVPDGMPLVWLLRRMGYPDQQRVYGPELMLHVCTAAEQERIAVGFYGSYPHTLERLTAVLGARFPGLDVRYACSPPFRPLTLEEDQTIVQDIRRSGVRILFVALGCPKQERWMAEHRGRIPAVALGVGAAFDFLSGRVPQAPAWMQRAGLEWFFRLLTEPRRLWRRYVKHNPRFVVLALRDLIRLQSGRMPITDPGYRRTL